MNRIAIKRDREIKRENDQRGGMLRKIYNV